VNRPVYLHSLSTVRAKNAVPQARAIDWIAEAHAQAESLTFDANMSADTGADTAERLKRLTLVKKLVHRYAVSPEQIEVRRTDCDDFESTHWEGKQLYALTPSTPEGATIEERARAFTEKAMSAFERLYPSTQLKAPPQHLIHVTCTGYDSPSAAHRFASGRGWDSTEVTQLYHMGCFASLPAIRLATALTREGRAEGRARIDVVHNELCSFHLNARAHTPEQIVVQTLFGDGHARYSVSLEPALDQRGFEVLATQERVLPGTHQEMTWIPGSHGMRMTLSREVPSHIKQALPEFVDRLLASCKSTASLKDRKGLRYAIHPGGPKVIEGVAEALDLSEADTAISRKVLRENGNLSSATLPHIWEAILQDPTLAPRTPVLSLAFGPGLTIFGGLFETL
jgi:predicted naringenin-chalcone synthase